MIIRVAALAGLIASFASAAVAAETASELRSPALRASVTVSGTLVRIGDFVENAGPAAQIALFRAPDPGTTGAVPVQQILSALRAHQVIGIDTRNLREVAVTRAARTLTLSEIESEIARALERRNGLGDAANISVSFDREARDVILEDSNIGALQVASARYEPRNGRFDVTFEIGNEERPVPTRLRYTGIAVETVEVALPLRNMERGEIIKSSDVTMERRPKAEAGVDAVTRSRVLGMQLRRSARTGQPLRGADVGKPDLVQRDQFVSIVYEAPGIYLTMRGKARESGAEGDTVTVLNLQSKRTVQGTIIGPGQVVIAPVASRPTTTAALFNPKPEAQPNAAVPTLKTE
mgnify:FL=1